MTRSECTAGLRIKLAQGHLGQRLFNKVAQRFQWLVVAILQIVVRPVDQAFVYSKHDDEENAYAWALAWSVVSDHPVYLGAIDEKVARWRLALVADAIGVGRPERIRVRALSRRRRLWLHIRSRFVFTVHLTLSGPRAPRDRLHVHLSHGTGPKTDRNPASTTHALMAASDLWREAFGRDIGLAAATPRIRGLPRMAAMLKSEVSPRALAALGIDPQRRFVLWMPTFRRTAFGSGHWEEGSALGADSGSLAQIRQIRRSASESGIQLVLKVHPIEADLLGDLADVVIVNDDIWRTGLTPYGLLGASDGLITDYSSVWVEYLVLRRPLLFFCPDLAEFETGIRGLYPPDYRTLVGRLRYADPADSDEFFEAVRKRSLYRPAEHERLMSQVRVEEACQLESGIVDVVEAAAEQGLQVSRLRPDRLS